MEEAGSDPLRRLAAIMAVDVAGSSRLIEADEGAALSSIHAVLNEVLRPSAAQHGGRVVKTLGDGALLEFASSVLCKEGEHGVRRSQSLTSWDLVRRGMWNFHRFTAEGHETARQLFSRAIEADPNASSGYVWLARTEGGRCSFGWTNDRSESQRVAHGAADKAVQSDPHNPYSHYAVAAACNGSLDFPAAVRAARQATMLNPNFALGHLILGVAVFHSGHAREAVGHLERGLRLSPYDPQHFTWLFNLSWAYRLSHQLDEALATAQRALALRPGWASGYKTIAATTLALGDHRSAVEAWRHAKCAADTGADLYSLLRCSHPAVVNELEEVLGDSPDGNTR